jgi:CubicO group peptidase (beta-lactamase class C family)
MLAKRSLAVLKEGIEAGLFSGAAYALVSKRASGGVGTLGRVAFDDECDRVDRDTLFDVASLTKPLATAMAVLQLVADGAVALESEVAPILGDAGRLDGVTIHHLLTHTSGLPPIPTEHGGSTSPVDWAIGSRLGTAPGAAYLYSDSGYIVLGELVRRLSGVGLDEWFQGRIAAPLYLTDGGFRPELSRSIVATSTDEALDGLPHDSRALALGGVAGHAGLFASINDMAAYVRALIGSGRALLPERLFSRLFETELDASIGAQSLAFFCRGNAYLPDIPGFGSGYVGHSGFTGCFLVIDRQSQSGACLLTNRVLNPDPDAAPFLELRRRWLAAAARDLGLE